MQKNNFLRYGLVFFALFSFLPLAFLGPTTQDDNTWLLVFSEVMASEHPLESYFDYTINYAKMQGRLGFFISFPLISFPYLFKSIFLIGIIKIAFLLGMIYVIYLTVKYFSDEINAALAVIFFSCFHTLTWFHSGFVSYSIQFYVLISIFLISLQLVDKYLVSGRIRYALIATVFYLICLSIEIFYVLFPAYILVIYFRDRGHTLLSPFSNRRVQLILSSLLFASVVYFIAYSRFRGIYASMYLGNQIASNLDLLRFVATDLKMALSAVPGVVLFFDPNYTFAKPEIFSAKGIIYCLSSFFIFPLFFLIRSILISPEIVEKPKNNSFALDLKKYKFLYCAIAVYLFFASVSLPSLTSLYQAMLLDYGLLGYIYTFIAFIILSIFTPVIFKKLLSASTPCFIVFAILFSLLALFNRGYNQKTFEEMSAATQRWEYFDNFLNSAPDLQNFGCISSESLFTSDHLVSVLDDYWTRFAKVRLGDKFNRTRFIRGVGTDNACEGHPGRFEFIFDSSNQIMGWYLYPSINKEGIRPLYIYINRQGTLAVNGGVISDYRGTVYVPAKGRSVQIVGVPNRVMNYQIYDSDVAISASAINQGTLIHGIKGLYPVEYVADGSPFWWAYDNSSFRLSLDRSLLPADVSLSFFITPVGAKEGDSFSVLCDGVPISISKIGFNPEQPFQIEISRKNLLDCQVLALHPSWSSVHLSPSDARVFSFQLAQFKYTKGVKR